MLNKTSVRAAIECFIFEEEIKDFYKEAYGISCKGLDTSKAHGYLWVLSKNCPLTFEEECQIELFNKNIPRDICKQDCVMDTPCVLTLSDPEAIPCNPPIIEIVV